MFQSVSAFFRKFLDRIGRRAALAPGTSMAGPRATGHAMNRRLPMWMPPAHCREGVRSGASSIGMGHGDSSTQSGSQDWTTPGAEVTRHFPTTIRRLPMRRRSWVALSRRGRGPIGRKASVGRRTKKKVGKVVRELLLFQTEMFSDTCCRASIADRPAPHVWRVRKMCASTRHRMRASTNNRTRYWA